MPSPSRIQSHVRYPLTKLLGSSSNVRLLRTMTWDSLPQSVSHLARQTGLSPQGVRLVLNELTQLQLVKVQGSGRALLYELNKSHAFAEALIALFRKEFDRWEGLMTSIREVLSRHGAAVQAAWLYGSVARGEDTPSSDLDMALLVANHAVADRVREDLMPLEDQQQLSISLTALTKEELAALPEDDRWWSGVVRDARILKGASPQFAKRHALTAAP